MCTEVLIEFDACEGDNVREVLSQRRDDREVDEVDVAAVYEDKVNVDTWYSDDSFFLGVQRCLRVNGVDWQAKDLWYVVVNCATIMIVLEERYTGISMIELVHRG